MGHLGKVRMHAPIALPWATFWLDRVRKMLVGVLESPRMQELFALDRVLSLGVAGFGAFKECLIWILNRYLWLFCEIHIEFLIDLCHAAIIKCRGSLIVVALGASFGRIFLSFVIDRVGFWSIYRVHTQIPAAEKFNSFVIWTELGSRILLEQWETWNWSTKLLAVFKMCMRRHNSLSNVFLLFLFD